MKIMKFTTDQEIRALSWKQPFASLMLHGKIETRTWDTKYRGWVLICTSKKPYSIDEEKLIMGAEQFMRVYKCGLRLNELNMNGYAIAIGRLVDSIPMTEDHEDACFVKYQEGLFCHIYKDVQAIQPFAWKGSQGWKTLDESVKNQIITL